MELESRGNNKFEMSGHRFALFLALAVSSVTALDISCTAESSWAECNIFKKTQGGEPTRCIFQARDHNDIDKDCQQDGNKYVCVKNCYDFDNKFGEDNSKFIGNYSAYECAVRIENPSEKETDDWTCKMKAHADGPWLSFIVTTTSGNGDKVVEKLGEASSEAQEQGDGERQGSEGTEATNEEAVTEDEVELKVDEASNEVTEQGDNGQRQGSLETEATNEEEGTDDGDKVEEKFDAGISEEVEETSGLEIAGIAVGVTVILVAVIIIAVYSRKRFRGYSPAPSSEMSTADLC